MQLFVKGQTLHALSVSEEASVGHLRALLAGLEGIPAPDQVITCGGSPLDDDGLALGALPELATLTLTARVLGG